MAQPVNVRGKKQKKPGAKNLQTKLKEMVTMCDRVYMRMQRLWGPFDGMRRGSSFWAKSLKSSC
jgi:hypothetical protein